MTSDTDTSRVECILGRKIKGLSGSSFADFESWPTPDEGALSDNERSRYLNRKLAVKMYQRGCAENILLEKYGIRRSYIYRLITERCLKIHSDGLIYGWRGLIPHLHIKPYARRKPINVDVFGNGAVGAMQTILDLHPDLRKKFENRILKSPSQDKLEETKRPRQAHWRWFLKELRELGYEQRGQWPFNTENNGYVTVCNYINDVLVANPKRAARALGGADLEKKLISGNGINRPVYKIFQRVEMDAHKIDGRFCVMVPTDIGNYVPKIIHRIWVIVIIEVFSRAVLGYFLSMGKEVSKDDVLRAVKAALSRWHRKILSFSEEAYYDEAALPSGISEKFIGVCWDETSVDGALAETCKHVEKVLKDVVGSVLITPYSGFSSRRSKDDRPFIEVFFRNLSSKGFQKLSNTTGSKPEANKGNSPDRVAVTSQFQLEYAEELLDTLIANYNATPHTSLGNRSPLEYLTFICSRPGTTLRYADPISVQGMLSFGKKCKVKGGLKEGRKPYINFVGARYTNESLQQRFDLIGKYIWVVNHLEDDARVAKASSLDGQQLGILRASPPWHRLPHSLKVRRAINSANNKCKFLMSVNVDAIEAFIDFCESQSDGKLPVHPAYLEVRRILSQQADQNVGKTVLDNALILSNSGSLSDSDTTATAAYKSNPADADTLPSRRMTATD
jgi:hypothetical protein